MADRNIKPVGRIHRHLPLQIGGDHKENQRRSEPAGSSEPTDDATADHRVHTPPESDPETYTAADLQEDTPESETAYNEAKEIGYSEGYDQGIAAGYDAGYEQGRNEAREAVEAERQAERGQLTAVLEALHQPLTSLREEITDSITEGTLDLAHRLVGEALDLDATLIRDTLLHILDEAAAHNSPGARLKLRIAPADHETTEQLIDNRRAGDLPVDLIDDENLGRGDVQATLAHGNGDPANQVEWDARLETRWQTIRQALRNPQPWIHSEAE